MIVLAILLIEVIISSNLVSCVCLNGVSSQMVLEDIDFNDQSVIEAAKFAVSSFENRINIDDVNYEILDGQVVTFIQNSVIFKSYSIKIWLHSAHAVCTFSIQVNTLLNTSVLPNFYCVSDNPPYVTAPITTQVIQAAQTI
jgi:hypothetical protein